MTSSSDSWNDSGTPSALRAQRWAPAELHQESAERPTGGTESPLAAGAAERDPVAEARAEAYAEGLADGQRMEAERMAPTVSALHQAIAEVRGSTPAWMDNLEKNLLTLAVAVARQVVGRELASDPDAVRQLVTRALGRFPVEESLTIRLHPSDLSRISAASVESPGSDPAAGRDVRWRADAHIAEGSCVVEGPERMVDGRVDKALLRIYQALVTDD